MREGAAGFEAPYEEAEFLERLEGDRELGEEIIELFLGQCPQMLSDMRDALSSGDLDLLGRLAHSVKGSVGVFAARESFAAAQGLETAACGGNMGAAQESWVRLNLEIRRLTAALEEKVGGRTPCDF